MSLLTGGLEIRIRLDVMLLGIKGTTEDAFG